MNVKKLNEELKLILKENEESLLLNELETICIEQGFSYKKYSDSIDIENFKLSPDYGSDIQNLTVYSDGSLDIRQNGPISLVPEDFEYLTNIFDLINEYREQ